MDNKPLISLAEASQLLNLKRSTLTRLIRNGVGPPCIRITRKIFKFELEDIENWVKNRKVDSL